jgi:flagellar basal-body rod protein FlgF
MANGIYVSMNGATARMEQLDSVADNLANAQTPGFKASRPSFEAFLARADRQDSPRIYPAAVATNVDLSTGAIIQTGGALDVVPSGKSFIGVKTNDGIALTRNGHLEIDATGTLRIAGHPVVDRSGTLLSVPPGARVRLEASGSLFANDQKVGELGLFNVSGPVDRIGPSLLAVHDQSDLTPSSDTVRIGELETGNASALEAAVQMVAAQRHFETSMQALQTYKKLDDRAVEVGRSR